ncbi:NAD(P)/FAD-dependent oxidoreductase [Zhihengliuella halotolerans]|uniref:3-phenylpropionate/trans-cinnamate dioxygenase ferredoxin reductase subunit n=1 Tax=Zhihengliuella halotolerans TaxID=370736 RepID=A0A4Q8AIT4_9MICC|nr:FAD-dependent oxidoreductase [Zhihengliuella halotolerans]RZU63669.1 3-phenylpropionate/trans-cinnamate dioxygenase ferredoxin reductase subunit [Zhihengliuella halotolerans]
MDETTAGAGVVVIGGGQAGIQAADSLRAAGYEPPVTVIADEDGLPYQRPPLSKDYLGQGPSPEPLPLRAGGFFVDRRIDLRRGVAATAIDRTRRRVALSDGEHLEYDYLILATGASNRVLTCPGAELPGVRGLRTLEDAQALRGELETVGDVVVVGAGFIGLEFAAAARQRGVRVTVLEFGDRPMGRALTPAAGDWFAGAHRRNGVDLRFGEGIGSIAAGDDGRAVAVVSTTGRRYRADLVVVGIGVVPNTGLAADAGLEIDNGIVVDESLATSDPAILAVGDCANFPSARSGSRLRLESVQNATDQGRHASRIILEGTERYDDVPWFWSTQGAIRLQIAGVSAPGDATSVVGDPAAGRFSVICHRDGRLSAVESVNSPADHLAARKLLSSGDGPSLQDVAAPGFSLKAFARNAANRTASTH